MAFILIRFQSKTNTFVFIYKEVLWHLHQYSSPKTVHVVVIIKQYLHDFHVTIVPCAWSQYVLSNLPPKLVAASKKKEYVWTDDEAELFLTQPEWFGCNSFLLHVTQRRISHVTIG